MQSEIKQYGSGIKQRILFMIDENGMVNMPMSHLNQTIIGHSADIRAPSSVLLWERYAKYQTGDEEHTVNYGIQLLMEKNSYSTSYRSVPIGQENLLPPISLARYYRALNLLNIASRRSSPDPYIFYCPFYKCAILSVGEPYTLYEGTDIEEAYSQAVLFVTNSLVGNRIPNTIDGRRQLKIPSLGMDKLNEIKQLRVPNLDSAIEACMEFLIPIDLVELENELRRGRLEESELVKKLLS